MEAFAAKKLEKKKLAEQQQKAQPTKGAAEERNEQKLRQLRTELGYPEAPDAVFALGKANCAAVWWLYSKSEHEIVGWEIHRYRKDKDQVMKGKWKYKGFTKVNLNKRKQYVVDDLTEGFQYRFTVKAINSKGSSNESSFSAPVVVETPLASGWFRFFDHNTDRFFYANLKTRQSRWDRPETDPYFLEESILFNFEVRELDHLRELFDEDINHFRHISMHQFHDILREVGERMSQGRIRKLFKTFAADGKVRILKSVTLTPSYRKLSQRFTPGPSL